MGSMRNRPQGRRRQKGNAILEGGLVLVPLMALIFAFIDHGLAIFLQNTFQHAVREGVRYAVTYQTQSGMGQDASIQTVVKRNAMGFLSNCNNCIKIRYYKPDSLVETTENIPGNLVEVSVEGYQLSWMAPLMRSAGKISIVARAADRMEGLPGGQSPPTR